MARLTCSVRVVQLRIESRLWMEKLEDQLMSVSGKLQRGMRWPVKVRKGPFTSFDTKGGNRKLAAGARRQNVNGGSRHSNNREPRVLSAPPQGGSEPILPRFCDAANGRFEKVGSFNARGRYRP